MSYVCRGETEGGAKDGAQVAGTGWRRHLARQGCLRAGIKSYTRVMTVVRCLCAIHVGCCGKFVV